MTKQDLLSYLRCGLCPKAYHHDEGNCPDGVLGKKRTVPECDKALYHIENLIGASPFPDERIPKMRGHMLIYICEQMRGKFEPIFWVQGDGDIWQRVNGENICIGTLHASTVARMVKSMSEFSHTESRQTSRQNSTIEESAHEK